MRHIRLFEGFNKDDYYQEIEHDIWFAKRLDRLDISDNLNNRIKDLFDSSFDYEKNDYLQGSVIYVNKEGIEIKIMIMDDDWYYVYLLYNKYSGYYKCDQFDGLKKLLKDKGII